MQVATKEPNVRRPKDAPASRARMKAYAPQLAAITNARAHQGTRGKIAACLRAQQVRRETQASANLVPRAPGKKSPATQHAVRARLTLARRQRALIRLQRANVNRAGKGATATSPLDAIPHHARTAESVLRRPTSTPANVNKAFLGLTARKIHATRLTAMVVPASAMTTDRSTLAYARKVLGEPSVRTRSVRLVRLENQANASRAQRALGRLSLVTRNASRVAKEKRQALPGPQNPIIVSVHQAIPQRQSTELASVQHVWWIPIRILSGQRSAKSVRQAVTLMARWHRQQ